MDKKSIWKMVIQTLISILSAIGTTLGLVSCMEKRKSAGHRCLTLFLFLR